MTARPVSRPGALSREELSEIVERIMRAEGAEAEQDDYAAASRAGRRSVHAFARCRAAWRSISRKVADAGDR